MGTGCWYRMEGSIRVSLAWINGVGLREEVGLQRKQSLTVMMAKKIKQRSKYYVPVR